MKQIYFILFFMFFGCKNIIHDSNNVNDSARLQISEKKDTAIRQKVNSDDNSYEIVDLKKTKADWLASYKDTTTVDTVFLVGKKSIHLLFKNYCLFDSSLVIPKGYVEPYGMDKFVSNNFATSVLLEVDGSKMIDTIVNKSFFEKALLLKDFYSLYDYGALVFSGFEIHNNYLEIDYTILIPLTDVGNIFKAELHYNGSVKALYAE